MLKRNENNPILIPELSWESKGAFNPNVIKTNQGYKMVYRAVDDQGISRVAAADSSNGIDWTNKRILVSPDKPWDQFGCEDPRVTFIDDKFYIFYTAISSLPPEAKSIKVALAISDDLIEIQDKKLITPFNAKASGLFPEKINHQYVLALTVNTDLPPSKIAIARSENLEDFWDYDFWSNWYIQLNQHQIPLSRINTDQIEIGSLPIKTDHGWLWFYCHIRNYYNSDKTVFGVESFLTDINNPTKIIGRTEKPLLAPKEFYEVFGSIKNVIFPSGAIEEKNSFRVYYGAADNYGAVASISKNKLWEIFQKNPIKVVLKVDKYSKNPILSHRSEFSWENQAVYNPSIVYEQNKFYLIYRALSNEMVSTLGCATSSDGFRFTERSTKPIYIPRADFESQKVKGNYSGCEDPRLTRMGDKYYLFYTAYDGLNPPRVALSSIKVADLINQNWQWSEPVLISPPQEDDKDACLFPEKINDKFLIFHRVGGRNIAIDWIDSFDHLSKTGWLEKEKSINRIEQSWQGEKIGINTPPIKTKEGWLILYHGVSDIDHQYRIGAMLLDLQNPTQVLRRTKFPILEATEGFEKKGLVDNVVFPCGSVIVQDTLYIAYGCADFSIGIATVKVQDLLDYLNLN